MDVTGPTGKKLTLDYKTVKAYLISIPNPLDGKWVARVSYVHEEHDCKKTQNS